MQNWRLKYHAARRSKSEVVGLDGDEALEGNTIDELVATIAAALSTAYEAGLERAAMIAEGEQIKEHFVDLANRDDIYNQAVNDVTKAIRAAKETK